MSVHPASDWLQGYSFQPSRLGTLLVIIGVSLFSSLGIWQLHRADYKNALANEIENRTHRPIQPLETLLPHHADYQPLLFRTVTVTGLWDEAQTLFLDNQIYQHQAGYHIITPLRLPDQSAIWVNRGWIAVGSNRQQLPTLPTLPATPVTLTGQLRAIPAAPRWVPIQQDPTQQLTAKVWLQLDAAIFSQRSGYPLKPFMLFQAPDNPPTHHSNSLIRDWPPFNANITMHLGYAIQWFVFAGVALGTYLTVSIRKRPSQPK